MESCIATKDISAGSRPVPVIDDPAAVISKLSEPPHAIARVKQAVDEQWK